jgi:hypothetical protein
LIAAVAAAGMSPVPPTFLSGCWKELRDAGGWTEECWTDAHGGVMMGSGRDGGDAGVIGWEWMRIELRPYGTVTFYASPNGEAAVPFKAIESSARSITFVNAAHDYPQRIRYELKGDKLEAEISLIDGSKPVRWTYVREKP